MTIQNCRQVRKEQEALVLEAREQSSWALAQIEAKTHDFATYKRNAQLALKVRILIFDFIAAHVYIYSCISTTNNHTSPTSEAELER